MAESRRGLEQTRPQQAGDTLTERYSKQAAWHQLRAPTELGRMEEFAVRGLPLEQQEELLLYALSEAVMAWRLLHCGQQEASSPEAAERLQARLAKVYALVESIQRALYATGAGSGMQERAGQ